MALPLLWMILSSFKSEAESLVTPPTLLPDHWTGQAYGAVVSQTSILRYMLNSGMVAVATTTLVIVLSALAAYPLVRFTFPGAEWLTRSTLVFYSMPPILLVVPIVQIFVTVHLVDSLVGLVIVYTALYLPLGIWLLRGYFIGLDPSPEEAARVDGATKFGAFWRIGLPQSVPGLAIIAVFVFNASMNEYLYASVLLQTPNKATMPSGLATFIGEVSIYSWPMLMVAGILAVLPIFVIYVFAQRHIAGNFMSL
jgi:multiple sugar transport system permease protein